MLVPHPTTLSPLPRGAHLRLPLPRSPSPPPPLISPAPTPRWPPPPRARAYASGEPVSGGVAAPPGPTTLDALLPAAELLCLAPPAIWSAVCAVRLVLSPSGGAPGPARPLAGLASGRLFVAQYVLLVGAVAIGALIRRRQWGQFCRVGSGGAGAAKGLDLAGRLEKVEESVRSVVAAVGVLSRTVEKLGVRFRVLRRTLRDPISETATLAEKNSEATRMLAAQEDHLEKEIGAIQKVLFAMQEQQEKQLELILAIGEASMILADRQTLLGDDTAEPSHATPEKQNQQSKRKAETVTGGNNKP